MIEVAAIAALLLAAVTSYSGYEGAKCEIAEGIDDGEGPAWQFFFGFCVLFNLSAATGLWLKALHIL